MTEKESSNNEGTGLQVAAQGQFIIDALRDNALRMVDEAANFQPQLAHTISKFNLDSFETAKSLIENSFASQQEVFSMVSIPTFLQQELLPEQVAKQSAEITNNAIRSVGIFNTIGVNALDAHRENLRIYSRTLDAAIKYNTDALKSMAQYWTLFA